MTDSTVQRRPEDVPRRALGTRIRLVNGEFMVGVEDHALHLAEPGSLIFSSLDGRRSLADVAALVAAEYDVEYQEALADVSNFLGDLTAEGIVEW